MTTLTETRPEDVAPLAPAEKRADLIAHIRECKVCGNHDTELMDSLDTPDLSDEEIEEYARTAHEIARHEQRQRYIRRNA